MSYIMAISWCTLESLRRNPDWFLFNKKFHLRTPKYYQIATFQIFLNKLAVMMPVMVMVLIKWEYNAKNYKRAYLFLI